MRRFCSESSGSWRRPLGSAALFLMLFLFFLLGISRISRETETRQAESLRQSILRSIAHCYAAEGYYPESLEYLKEHYGIRYDTDTFFVDYQVLGENIFPDVTILEK